MKLEKINDKQIRCTLTSADLAERQLKLSELAYGSEKAKSLFHDMMQQAAQDFGFEADDMPLMIEAIPTSSDSIVLVITKVDDPDELDTRFSKFSPSPNGPLKSATPLTDQLKKLEGAEGFRDLLEQVKEAVGEPPKNEEPKKEEPEDSTSPLRFFSFSTLEGVIKASTLLHEIYDGENTLYKDEPEDMYILVLTQSGYSSTDYSKICNMLSEFGSNEPGNGATLAFLEEHCKMIISRNAIQVLASL